MPRVKISNLPAAAPPLTGSELVPVVQGGVTSQTTLLNVVTDVLPSVLSSRITINPDGSFTFYGASGQLRFTINADGSFTFYNASAQVTARLDASGNLSVKGNVTAYATL